MTTYGSWETHIYKLMGSQYHIFGRQAEGNTYLKSNTIFSLQEHFGTEYSWLHIAEVKLESEIQEYWVNFEAVHIKKFCDPRNLNREKKGIEGQCIFL